MVVVLLYRLVLANGSLLTHLHGGERALHGVICMTHFGERACFTP